MGFSEQVDSGEAMSLVLIWNLKRDLETFSVVLLLLSTFFFFFPLFSSLLISPPLVFYFFYSTKRQFVFTYNLFTSSFFCFLTHSPSLALLALSLLILKKAYLFLCVARPPPPTKQNNLLGRVVLCVCFARF